jgi:CMP-N-acetylneuraminic acid synthetase
VTVWGVIFARGGSKGVPGKNLRLVGGKSLLEHSIRVAQATSGIDRVVCSTDSSEIREAALRSGAEAPFLRPAELAGDDSPEWASWQHLVEYLMAEGASGGDTLVSLPTTSPLRSVADVESVVRAVETNGADVVLAVTEAARSPWFNMVTMDADSRVSVVIENGAARFARRQDVPKVYDLTTIAYAARFGYVRSAAHMFEGDVVGVEIPRERAIDIDTELDLGIADYLYRKREGDEA